MKFSKYGRYYTAVISVTLSHVTLEIIKPKFRVYNVIDHVHNHKFSAKSARETQLLTS
jgi:hypothetical protein